MNVFMISKRTDYMKLKLILRYIKTLLNSYNRSYRYNFIICVIYTYCLNELYKPSIITAKL